MLCIGKIRGRGVSYYESKFDGIVFVLSNGKKETRYIFLASEYQVNIITAATFLCMKLDGETDACLDDFIYTELDDDGNHIKTF